MVLKHFLSVYFIACWWFIWSMYSCWHLESMEQNEEVLEHPTTLHDSTAKDDDSSPIEPTISNTFIVVLNKNFLENERNQTLRVEKTMKYFREILEQSRISFIFTYTYIYGPNGFAFALRHPKKIEFIKKLRVLFISKIVQDAVIGIQNNIIQEDVLVEFAQVPSELMKIPEKSYSGYRTGKGVTVAVLDSGILYTLRQFVVPGEQCTFSIWNGCRVKKTLDFVKTVRSNLPNRENSQNADNSYDVPSTNRNSPIYGLHGTQMASLIGGTGVKSPGIASQVEFYDFRVLDKRCTLTRVCYAISKAIENGADIVSMSFGLKAFPHELFRSVFKKSSDGNDVLLINAIGNLGENGLLHQANSISQDQGVISVSSFLNPIFRWKRLHVTKDRSGHDLRVDVKGFAEFQKTSFDQFCFNTYYDFLIVSEQTIQLNLNFDEYHQLSKTFILLDCSQTNECLRLLQILDVDPKVMGVLIACPEDLPRHLFQFFRYPLGQLVDKTFHFHTWRIGHYARGRFSVGLQYPLNTLYSPSPISSYGPSANMEILPDISTIGCKILVYKAGDGDNTESFFSRGTSYANAILAGALSRDVSRRKEKGLRVTLDDTRTRMQNTAMPSTTFHMDGLLYAYPVIKQGAGLLQLEPMMNTFVRIIPSKIEFGFIRPRTADGELRLRANLRLQNDGPYDVKYFLMKLRTISKFYSPNDDLYKDFFGQMHITFWDNGIKLVKQSLMVKRYTQKNIELTFQFPMVIPDFTYMNGYVLVIPEKFSKNENDPFEAGYDPGYSELSVPFLFYYGDTALAPAFSLFGSKNAFLSRSSSLLLNHLVNSEFPLKNKPEGFEAFIFSTEVPKFTFLPNDRPFVSLCTLFPLKNIQFDLFEAKYWSNCGTIRIYTDMPVGCSLHLVSAHSLAAFGLKLDEREVATLGWSGKYTEKDSGKKKKVVPGYYHICAKGVLDVSAIDSKSREYEWCSVRLEVISPPSS